MPLELSTRDESYTFYAYRDSFQPSSLDLEQDQKYESDSCRRKKNVDSRYNCYGHCFASGLGWVGSKRETQENVKIFMLGEQDIEIDNEFNARKILVGNSWRKLLEINYEIDEPIKKPISALHPGDIVTYSRSSVGQVEHVGILVDETLGNGILAQSKVLSKFGMGGEFIHPISINVLTNLFPIVEIWGDRI